MDRQTEFLSQYRICITCSAVKIYHNIIIRKHYGHGGRVHLCVLVYTAAVYEML